MGHCWAVEHGDLLDCNTKFVSAKINRAHACSICLPLIRPVPLASPYEAAVRLCWSRIWVDAPALGGKTLYFSKRQSTFPTVTGNFLSARIWISRVMSELPHSTWAVAFGHRSCSTQSDSSAVGRWPCSDPDGDQSSQLPLHPSAEE